MSDTALHNQPQEKLLRFTRPRNWALLAALFIAPMQWAVLAWLAFG